MFLLHLVKHYDICWLTGNNRIGGVATAIPQGTITNNTEGSNYQSLKER